LGTLAACAAPPAVGPGGLSALGEQDGALETATLIITEVAQSTLYGGSTADKVEIYCASAEAAPRFECAIRRPPGAQAALRSKARLQPMPGSWSPEGPASPTRTKSGWRMHRASSLPNSRVGPFSCSAGAAQAPADCSIAAFSPCGTPNVSTSSGACSAGDVPEAFTYSVKFTMNQHGLPESSCTRPVCQELLAAIDTAETSIDFAIYGIRAQPDIIDALVAAQGRGVAVRG
jgi:hypothetical protein